MSLEGNEQLARADFTAFGDQDAAWWQRFIAPRFVRHDPGLDFTARGLEGVARLGRVMHGVFRDVELPVDEVIARGDRVLVRLRGVHTGEFQGVAAAGQPIDIAVMDYFRVEDGRLAEHRALVGNLSLLKPIGVTAA